MKIKIFLLVISLVLLSSCLKRKIRTINNKERKEEVNLADSNDKNSDFYIEFGRLKYKGILDYIEVFKSKSIGNPDYRILLKQEIDTTSLYPILDSISNSIVPGFYACKNLVDSNWGGMISNYYFIRYRCNTPHMIEYKLLLTDCFLSDKISRLDSFLSTYYIETGSKYRIRSQFWHPRSPCPCIQYYLIKNYEE